jgi:hypothetical protein
MRKTVANIGIIILVIGGSIRLFSPKWNFGPELGTFAFSLGLIGDVVGSIGVILLIYGLAAKRPPVDMTPVGYEKDLQRVCSRLEELIQESDRLIEKSFQEG